MCITRAEQAETGAVQYSVQYSGNTGPTPIYTLRFLYGDEDSQAPATAMPLLQPDRRVKEPPTPVVASHPRAPSPAGRTARRAQGSRVPTLEQTPMKSDKNDFSIDSTAQSLLKTAFGIPVNIYAVICCGDICRPFWMDDLGQR